MTFQYQLLPNLSPEEYSSLKDDIQRRGVQVPVEFDEAGNVLDGHHRLQICAELGIKDYPSIVRVGMDDDAKIEHVLSLNLNRRHLDKEQRKELHAKLREMGWSLRKIADTTKVTHETVRNDLSGVNNLTPDEITGKDGKQYPSVINKNNRDKQRTFGALSGVSVDDLPSDMMDSKTIKGIAEEKRKEQKRNDVTNQGANAELPIDITISIGDFRDVLANFPDNSIDLIFTDPPYDEETIPLYGDLARIGSRILKPGGSLIAYAGNYALPQYFDLMTPHLRYWWMLALFHDGAGGNARLIGKNVYVEWKPILWFVKEYRYNNEYIADKIITHDQGKDYHEWQQSIEEADYLINKLTEPGGIVLDPFSGSGTTLIAAKKSYRQAIGIELDEHRANAARKRIEDYFNDSITQKI